MGYVSRANSLSATGLVAILLSAALDSCGRAKFLGEPRVTKVQYGSAPSQFAELRLPSGQGPFPVVAILHGGCWIEYADLDYMAALAAALTKQGFATWNIEYRRAHEPGGGWPNTFEDAERGVRALIAEGTRRPLDLRRVVVIGHSAGGQLALYVASRLGWPAISLAGIVDMEAYIRAGPKGCVAGELLVMGGTPEEHPQRYAKVSPARLLPLDIPQVLIWGTNDGIAPESLFADYERRADLAEIQRVTGAGHHDLCATKGPAWTTLLGALHRLANKGRTPTREP